MTARGQWHGAGRRCFVGLHGWSGDRGTFLPLVAHLPEGARLLALDQPGFGASPPPARWDFEAFTQPLLQALDREGVGRCTLVGNCAGAVVAMELALRQPERFERLVLVDPFAYAPWYFRLLTWGWPGWLFYHLTFANPVGRWITNQALASRRTADTDLTGGFGQVRHDVTFRFLRLLCSVPSVERYAGLAMPVTLLYGARTFGAVKASVRRFVRLWPGARAHVLAGAGHLPIQEATAELARLSFDEDTDNGSKGACGLPHAPGDPAHRAHLGHDPGLGAPLQGHRARADEREHPPVLRR